MRLLHAAIVGVNHAGLINEPLCRWQQHRGSAGDPAQQFISAGAAKVGAPFGAPSGSCCIIMEESTTSMNVLFLRAQKASHYRWRRHFPAARRSAGGTRTLLPRQQEFQPQTSYRRFPTHNLESSSSLRERCCDHPMQPQSNSYSLIVVTQLEPSRKANNERADFHANPRSGFQDTSAAPAASDTLERPKNSGASLVETKTSGVGFFNKKLDS